MFSTQLTADQVGLILRMASQLQLELPKRIVLPLKQMGPLLVGNIGQILPIHRLEALQVLLLGQ